MKNQTFLHTGPLRTDCAQQSMKKEFQVYTIATNPTKPLKKRLSNLFKFQFFARILAKEPYSHQPIRLKYAKAKWNSAVKTQLLYSEPVAKSKNVVFATLDLIQNLIHSPTKDQCGPTFDLEIHKIKFCNLRPPAKPATKVAHIAKCTTIHAHSAWKGAMQKSSFFRLLKCSLFSC